MTREYYIFDEQYRKDVNAYSELAQHAYVGGFDVGYYWDEQGLDFVNSPEFNNMPVIEQAMSRSALKACLEKRPWQIHEIESSDESLLMLPNTLYSIESNNHDAAILSGLQGWEVEQQLRENYPELVKELGNLALDGYIKLGLAALEKDQSYNDNAKASYAEIISSRNLSYFIKEDNDIIMKHSVGGTFHGDFSTEWKRFVTSGPVLDPSGQKRPFAPNIAGDHVGAYHSTESAIALAMTGYLAQNDDNKLAIVKRELLAKIDEADLGRAGGNFADFGDEFKGNRGIILRSDQKNEAGDVIGEFIVGPPSRFQDYDYRMQIVCARGGVELRNIIRKKVSQKKTKVTVDHCMTIADKDIPMFVATMTVASAGRTSIAQIRKAIADAHYV